MTGEDLTSIVRQAVERACREFTARTDPMGFERSRKMFWTRPREHTVDFIHLHRFGVSYGKPIGGAVDLRIHFGIRVLNDSFEALALNGPKSDDGQFFGLRYHLRFNAKSGSQFDRCVNDMLRFVEEQGGPWFARFAQEEHLLGVKSPLRDEAKALLRAALAGEPTPEHLVASWKLLGLTPPAD